MAPRSPGAAPAMSASFDSTTETPPFSNTSTTSSPSRVRKNRRGQLVRSYSVDSLSVGQPPRNCQGRPTSLKELFAQNQVAPGNEDILYTPSSQQSNSTPSESEMKDMLEAANMDLHMLSPNSPITKLHPNFPCVLAPTRSPARTVSSSSSSTGNSSSILPFSQDNAASHSPNQQMRLLSASTPDLKYNHNDDTDDMSFDFSEVNWKDRHLDSNASAASSIAKKASLKPGAPKLRMVPSRSSSGSSVVSRSSVTRSGKKKPKKLMDVEKQQVEPAETLVDETTSSGNSDAQRQRLDSVTELQAYGFNENQCHNCGIHNSEIEGCLIQCARCKKAYYCSTRCFNEDLAAHQQYCFNTEEQRQIPFSEKLDSKVAAEKRNADSIVDYGSQRSSTGSGIVSAPTTPIQSAPMVPQKDLRKEPLSEGKKKKKVKLTPRELGLTAEEGKDPVKLQKALKRWKKEQKRMAASETNESDIRPRARSVSRTSSMKSISPSNGDDSSRKGRTRSRSRARIREEHRHRDDDESIQRSPVTRSVHRRRSMSRGRQADEDNPRPAVTRSRSRSRARAPASPEQRKGRSRSVARRPSGPEKKSTRSKSLARTSRKPVDNSEKASRSRSKSVPRPGRSTRSSAAVEPDHSESSSKSRRKSIRSNENTGEIRRKSTYSVDPGQSGDPSERSENSNSTRSTKSRGRARAVNSTDKSLRSKSRGRVREKETSSDKQMRAKSRARATVSGSSGSGGRARSKSRGRVRDGERPVRSRSRDVRTDEREPCGKTEHHSPTRSSSRGIRKDTLFHGDVESVSTPAMEDRRSALLRQPTGRFGPDDLSIDEGDIETPATPNGGTRVTTDLTTPESGNRKGVGRIGSRISALTNAFKGNKHQPAPETPTGMSWLSRSPKRLSPDMSVVSDLSPESTASPVKTSSEAALPYASPLGEPSPTRPSLNGLIQNAGQPSVESPSVDLTLEDPSPKRSPSKRKQRRRLSSNCSVSTVEWDEVDFTALAPGHGNSSVCSVVRKKSDVSELRDMFESRNKSSGSSVRSSASGRPSRRVKDKSDEASVRDKLQKAGISVQQINELKAAGLKITDV